MSVVVACAWGCGAQVVVAKGYIVCAKCGKWMVGL